MTKVVSEAFDSFSIIRGTGFFGGKKEDSLQIKIASTDALAIIRLALRLINEFNQTSVGFQRRHTYHNITQNSLICAGVGFLIRLKNVTTQFKEELLALSIPFKETCSLAVINLTALKADSPEKAHDVGKLIEKTFPKADFYAFDSTAPEPLPSWIDGEFVEDGNGLVIYDVD